jgi:hypothetical protein
MAKKFLKKKIKWVLTFWRYKLIQFSKEQFILKTLKRGIYFDSNISFLEFVPVMLVISVKIFMKMFLAAKCLLSEIR